MSGYGWAWHLHVAKMAMMQLKAVEVRMVKLKAGLKAGCPHGPVCMPSCVGLLTTLLVGAHEQDTVLTQYLVVQCGPGPVYWGRHITQYAEGGLPACMSMIWYARAYQAGLAGTAWSLCIGMARLSHSSSHAYCQRHSVHKTAGQWCWHILTCDLLGTRKFVSNWCLFNVRTLLEARHSRAVTRQRKQSSALHLGQPLWLLHL